MAMSNFFTLTLTTLPYRNPLILKIFMKNSLNFNER